MLPRLIAKKLFATSAEKKPFYYGLDKFGIKNKKIKFNLSVPELYEIGTRRLPTADPDTLNNAISSTGALCAYSGAKTGRSPKDKRVVEDEHTKSEIWWGNVNIPIPKSSYDFCERIVINYLNNKRRLYIVDGYVGWDPDYRLKIRILCTRAYHALFMNNMLIRPTLEEINRDFRDGSKIDFHVFNAGEF